MKKFLVILLAVCMIFAFAACSSAPATDEGSGDETALTADTIKIGHIHINDEAEQGYSTAHINAINNMAANLGIPAENVIGKYNVGEDSGCETALRELAEAGCNVIFADSFGFEDYVIEVAKDYPDILFCHATGYQAADCGLDNVCNFFGSIYEARFLTGIVAGMTTKSNTLGYVTAMDCAECCSGFTGFFLGARYVNPDVKMNVIYTNSWYDVTAETQAAQALISSGADVICQHADSTATQAACEADGKTYSIGYNTDMSAAAPNANLCSAVWDWTPAYTYFVESVLNGEKPNTDWSGDLASGMVNIVYNDAVIDALDNGAEIKAAVEDARAKIESGELKVFAGPLTENGTEIIAEGDFYPESVDKSAPSWYHIIDGITVIK
ncbi:MAG: BMP family ABC transporter substrate-binding protein [Firmicutes bacterium]|nr:BMP family ABC transporter substrate-binding protein [Bacillota bacterium]